jgi:phenylpropionate dioxygenase-like ring-hydroxylating dioxygenase large terminal subunit
MILVEETKNIQGAIRCPYHSWCYSTEGKLVSTPHVGGPGQNTDANIDRSKLSLVEIRSHIWRDVIWINVDGCAKPFEEVMANTIERWKELDQNLYHGGDDGKFSLKVQSNWKLAVENYCESYHLPWVHPGLNSYSRLEDHYNIVEYGSHSGQGSLVYRQLTDDKGKTFPDFENLSEKWSTGAEYIALYPNVLLGAHRDHAYVIILLPLSFSETIENIHIYYSQPDTSPSMKKKNKEQWKEIFEEDIFVVEGMQAGRLGIKFDGGRFSPKMDEPTHCFHDWVASKVDDFRNQNRQIASVTE